MRRTKQRAVNEIVMLVSECQLRMFRDIGGEAESRPIELLRLNGSLLLSLLFFFFPPLEPSKSCGVKWAAAVNSDSVRPRKEKSRLR